MKPPVKVIPEWRKAWKFASVRVLVAAQFLPDIVGSLSNYAPDGWSRLIFHGTLIVAFAARMLYQPKVRADGDQ